MKGYVRLESTVLRSKTRTVHLKITISSFGGEGGRGGGGGLVAVFFLLLFACLFV